MPYVVSSGTNGRAFSTDDLRGEVRSRQGASGGGWCSGDGPGREADGPCPGGRIYFALALRPPPHVGLGCGQCRAACGTLKASQPVHLAKASLAGWKGMV